MVCVVEAAPGTPAAVTDIPIQAGRRLRTLRGTVAELSVLGEMVGDDFLRVWVREPARAGLREEVTALLPNALEVRIDPEFAAPARRRPAVAGAGPHTGRAVRRVPRHARAWPIRGSRSCSARCTSGSPADAPGAAGDGRVRVVPRAHHRRLHRSGVLRPGRAHRLGQVHGDRRDDVRAVRLGAALGQRAHGGAGAGADRRARHGAVRVRRRRAGRAAPSATSSRASCGGPRAAACRCARPGWSGCGIPRAPAPPRRRPSRWPTARLPPPRPSRSCSACRSATSPPAWCCRRASSPSSCTPSPASGRRRWSGCSGSASTTSSRRRRTPRRAARSSARRCSPSSSRATPTTRRHAERAAAERVTALAAVRARVDEATPVLTAAAAELAEADGDDRTAVRRAVAAHRPRRARRARRAGGAPRVVGGRVGGGQGRARRRRDRRHRGPRGRSPPRPPRGPLETARRHHAERAGIAAELPGARDRQAKARESEATAGSDAAAARAAVDEARAAREAAAAALAESRGTSVAGSRRSGTRSGRSSRPRGWTRSTGAGRAPSSRATGRRPRWPPRSGPTPTRGAPSSRRPTGPRWSRPGAIIARSSTPAPSTAARAKRRDAARAAVAAATARVEEAGAHVEHARARRAAGLRADLAAALRPGLALGEECPVCAQPVAVLPAPLPEGDLAAADHALAAAEAALDEARRAEASGDRRARTGRRRAAGGVRHGRAADGRAGRVTLPPAARRPRRPRSADAAPTPRRDGAATGRGAAGPPTRWRRRADPWPVVGAPDEQASRRS